MPAARYAELHCRSNFSFLEGGSHPEELVERAVALGLTALALTDRDGLYGAVRFAKAAKPAQLAALAGAELTLDAPELRPQRRDPTPLEHARFPRLVLLAENEGGYANLARAISTAQMRGRKRDARLRLEDLDGKSEGLVALSASAQGYAEEALLRGDLAAARERAAALHELFPGRFYLELQHHLRPEDARLVLAQAALAEDLGLPCVATNGVAYAAAGDAPLCDVLACIKHKTTLQTAGTLLPPNHEFYLKSPAQMARLFAPYPHALHNTLAIAERCTFRLERLAGQFPLFPVPAGESTHSYLRTLVLRGARKRYGEPLPSNVERQLEYELGIIARMDLAGYFLVVWDIARAAEELRVLAQGRGSAANSAVCYALGITAVDPVGMNLLFERFLSEERNEIPDIDIDFAHQDREKVIQYVYRRYGREHAAMTAEVITYHARSAIRDVGKALGLSLAQVDAIAKEYDARESLAGALGTRAVKAPSGELLLQLCRRIDGFPRHLGIHSGGMVITRDPLVQVAPVEWATMRDRSVVQWDKDDLADLGLIKIDLLGLGMLSLLREAFALFERRYGDAKPPLSLASIPADDAPTYAMLQQADTVGVFQIESRAQQSMLPRMKPACFYDIVMQVAIIRPGPIQGDMIHPFLRRRNGLEPVTYPHPKLKPILERTLGVPLFQEQGMRMAIEAGGFSPGQADQLRRAMGHKRSRARMAEIYPKLVAGMVANGIDGAAAERLFHMLEGFADYGFPESHAASFALLSYASAYVKCHEPAIFLAAILNVQPMGFYSTEVLVNDARRHAVTVKPVEVDASEYWSFVDAEGATRLGFHIVRGLGEAQRERLQAALAQGPFGGLEEFAARTGLTKGALENLAIAGAFAPWFAARREAMWAVRGLDERAARGALGRGMDVEEPAPAFAPLAAREETAFDLWGTGSTTGLQPLAHFRTELDARGVLAAARLPEQPNHLVCKVGGMVITRQRPGTAKGFVFLTLEDETGLVNVIVKPSIYERYRRLIRSSAALVIEGTLQKEQGCVDVLAKRFWPLDTNGTTAGVQARNFH
ncbi:MAG: error-prone DNA polymerase [Candidatus Baltobacteraceae bacterium]|jgi:error-prone DNA polymerase